MQHLAVTVHTWLDEHGVRHYADAPPAAGEASEQIEFAAADLAVNDAGEDYYSITNQWQRLRAEREAEAEQALARQRLRAEQRQAATDYPPPSNRGGYLPFLPYGAGYGFDRRHGYGRSPAQSSDRGAHLDHRRRHGFAPTPAPLWPRQR